MKVSRIDLADFGSPERIVQGILDLEPQLPIPVPVKELALQLDIISIEALETEGFEGGLLTDANKAEGIILVNESSRPRRRRFTIGHEPGHFLMPTHLPKKDDGFLCSFDDMRRADARPGDRAAEMEVEANRFAALLLMPTPVFRRDMRRRKGAELEHVVELSDKYDTSREATARRYVDLHDEPIAAVVSHQGRIQRCHRHKEFPFLETRNGSALPRDCPTSRIDKPVGTISNWDEVDAALWLPSERGRRLPTLYEQVLVQQDGYRLTLLSIETEDEEGYEETITEAWTPRFRR
jgi:Zn-dependent peptidase ImmA (M78 family)